LETSGPKAIARGRRRGRAVRPVRTTMAGVQETAARLKPGRRLRTTTVQPAMVRS
jgi:hypothetical protein